MARRILALGQDRTRLVPSWRDGPFGVEAAGEVLLPGPSARLGTTTFDSWLDRSPGPVDAHGDRSERTTSITCARSAS
jgi:hypothetical protein